MIKNYLDIDDILFNSDIQEINNKINKHKKASSASLQEEVTKFINDTCKILEKLLNKELSSNECLIVIKNNFNKIIKCSRQSTVTNHILNNVFNLLYEKFILIIIYICKSNADQQIIQATSNLIYNAISHIYHHLFSLNNKNEASQNNQNRLLIHIWDILLLLIYSKDKRLRTNTCQFLHHFVYNCCIDEIVINSDLYHKHIKNILNLFLTNVSSTSGVGSSGSSGSKDKINLCIILVKLLQSFQSDEVMSIFLNIINNTIDKYRGTSTNINSFDVNSNLDTNGEMEIVYAILEIIDIVDLNLLQKIITLLSFNIKLNVTVYKKLYSYLSNIGIFNLLYIFYNFRYLVKPNSANLALQSTGYRELNLEFNKMIMKWVKENGLDQFINYLLSNTLQVNIIVSVLYNFFDHVTQDNEYPELKNQILTNQNVLNSENISTSESILNGESILMYLYGNDQIVNLLMKLEEKLEENSQGFDSYKLYINELNLILLSLNGAELRLFKGNSHLVRLSFSELVTNNPEMLQDVKNLLLKTLTQVNISHVMKCLIDEYVQMNSSGLDFITVVNFGIFTGDNIIYNISILLLQSFDFNITLLLTTLDNLALVDTSVNELSPVDTTINSKSLDTSINNSKSLDTSLRRGNLYRLIIVYVYFNYNFVNGGDLDMVNDIFNNYIINILKEINSSNSGNSKTNDKEEELLVNIMVMKCIYVYNIIMNSYNDKVISIYYNILNNNIQMFNNNNVFIYKIEVLLSIIIDLLYIKRDSNQNQEVSIGLPIELKVYRLILNILTYDLRISPYIYNLILNKLLYKLLLVLSIRNDITVNSYKSSDDSKRTNVVSSVNDMLKDYFIVIMEMILFDEKLNTNSLSILFTTIFNLYTHNTGNYFGNSGGDNSIVNSSIVNCDTDGTTRMLLVESIKYLISNSLQYYIMNVEPSSVGSFSGIISRLKLLMINCNEGIVYNVTILMIIFVNYKMNVMEIYDIIKWIAKAEFASELGDLYSLLHFYNVNINASKKLSNLLSSVKALVNPKTNSVPNVRHIQTITEKYNMNNDPSPFCRHLFN